MLTVKIAQLKSGLSGYLRKVRRGSEVLVLDRETPIARLIPFAENEEDFEVLDARDKVSALKTIRPVPLKGGVDPLEALRKDRDGG